MNATAKKTMSLLMLGLLMFGVVAAGTAVIAPNASALDSEGGALVGVCKEDSKVGPCWHIYEHGATD